MGEGRDNSSCVERAHCICGRGETWSLRWALSLGGSTVRGPKVVWESGAIVTQVL